MREARPGGLLPRTSWVGEDMRNGIALSALSTHTRVTPCRHAYQRRLYLAAFCNGAPLTDDHAVQETAEACDCRRAR